MATSTHGEDLLWLAGACRVSVTPSIAHHLSFLFVSTINLSDLVTNIAVAVAVALSSLQCV
jgi:hypothetical protein